MALTVGTDTYMTLEEINGYHLTYGNTAWSAATEADQTAAIYRAMRFIDSQRFKGTKANYDQGLEWPRSGVVDRNGFTIPNTIVPVHIGNAEAEAALIELNDPGALTPAVVDPGLKREKKITGSEKEWFGGGSRTTSHSVINNYLRGYVYGNGNSQVIRT